VPRGHSLGGREVWEKIVGLAQLQSDRPQPSCAIGSAQAGEQPLAQAAVRVVKDRPAALGRQTS
jgi:hypothetical protein